MQLKNKKEDLHILFIYMNNLLLKVYVTKYIGNIFIIVYWQGFVLSEFWVVRILTVEILK